MTNLQFRSKLVSAKIIGQFSETVDGDIRPRGAQRVLVAQAVSHAAGDHAGALAGFDIGIAVADDKRSAGAI